MTKTAFPCGRSEGTPRSAGLWQTPRSLSHRITLEDTEISSWGAAEQARKTLLDALSNERFPIATNFGARLLRTLSLPMCRPRRRPTKHAWRIRRRRSSKPPPRLEFTLMNPERAQEVQAQRAGLGLNLLGRLARELGHQYEILVHECAISWLRPIWRRRMDGSQRVANQQRKG